MHLVECPALSFFVTIQCSRLPGHQNDRTQYIWLRGIVCFDVQVSRDEEELAKKRLGVKRGLPLQVHLVCA